MSVKDEAMCGLCSFFDQGLTQVSGYCRRRAPTVSAEGKYEAQWPRVCSGDWCGEFVKEAGRVDQKEAPFDPNASVEDIHFTDLELPFRVTNCLTQQLDAASLTAKRLCEMDGQALLRLQNFGKKSLFELHEALVAKGFKPLWNAKEPVLQERLARSQYHKFQSQCGYSFERPSWDLCKTFAAYAERTGRVAYDLSEIKRMLESNSLPFMANSESHYLRKAVIAWENHQVKYGRKLD